MSARVLPTVLVLLLAAPPLYAQEAETDADATRSRRTCVDVRIGNDESYGCLNDSLRRLAERAHAPLATGMLSATSPAPAVGSFNRAATAERMGNTFGHSAFSQRPPKPVFNELSLGR